MPKCCEGEVQEPASKFCRPAPAVLAASGRRLPEVGPEAPEWFWLYDCSAPSGAEPVGLAVFRPAFCEAAARLLSAARCAASSHDCYSLRGRPPEDDLHFGSFTLRH